MQKTKNKIYKKFIWIVAISFALSFGFFYLIQETPKDIRGQAPALILSF